MILHCKNAEMTILLSFLHFYSVKSYNFIIIVISAFLQCKIIQFLLFFFLRSKYVSDYIFFSIFFSPYSDLNILKKKSINQVLKKRRPKGKEYDVGTH